MRKLTLKALRAEGARWQKKLRLQDWEIVYEVANTPDKMTVCDGSRVGEALLAEQHKKATIRVAPPPPGSMITWQSTLVHELLELHFAPWKEEANKGGYFTEQEQVLNIISGALTKSAK